MFQPFSVLSGIAVGVSGYFKYFRKFQPLTAAAGQSATKSL